MKKISLVLVFIALFSACNKEIEDSTIEDSTIILANDSSMTQRGASTNNTTTTGISLEKLQVYTYAIGRMFKANFQDTSFKFEVYAYTNSTGQQVVNLKEVLQNDILFRTRFIQSLHNMQLYNFGIPVNGAPSPSMYPPIGPVVNPTTYYYPYQEIAGELLNSLNNGNIQDNIEIYIARPVISSVYVINTINIAPHPLTEMTSTQGYIFKEGHLENTNTNATFDSSFLNSHSENVIIVRPYRDAAHPYNYIPVADFTTFYN